MDWQDVKAEFEWDGSWRDLYILDTDIESWQRALDLLRTGAYPLRFTVDSKEAELPTDVATIFSQWLEAIPSLSINVHGIRINCHFFIEKEIEFDIDPIPPPMQLHPMDRPRPGPNCHPDSRNQPGRA